MKITSEAFANGEKIPAQYTCDGANVNPPLKIEELPVGTKTLVVIMDDPDAPGGIWTHWTLWNIDPSHANIHENEVPPMATEGITDSGNYGYGGPCPPSGSSHRYRFHIYALSRELMLNPDSNKEYIMNAMHGLILGEAELVGIYERNQ